MDGVSVFVVLVIFTILHSPPRVSGESIVVVDDGTLRIDCGSSSNTSIGKRSFGADPKSSESIFVSTNSSVSSQLYRTARVFDETSGYRFSVRKQGRHLIRLYFFPFSDGLYDLSDARFSVAVQNLSLSEELRFERGPAVVKEYWLNVESEALLLSLAPSRNSFAFVNAIEVILVPGDLFPEGTALETVFRLNMGNESVSAENDTLWRSWIADGPFLLTQARFASMIPDRVVAVAGAESAAPKAVYSTATEIDMAMDVGYANLSWRFSGDVAAPSFDYLFRFHFCNFGGEASKKPRFNLYVNSKLVSTYGDQNADSVGVPYFLDAVVKATHRDGDPLFVTVGPRSVTDSHSATFLNGLEIMKLAGSLSSSEETTTVAAPRKTLVLVFGIVVSAGLLVVAVSAIFLLRCRRRRRRGGKVAVVVEEAGGVFSGAEIAYRFPLSAIREATEGFSEEMVIGAGGFGRVYKGILGEEGTAVAIKRGYTESTHGLAEFRTEIEMLSQFRHRHLVSLIGYCDENGEMIVIYEHVENGTLKDRLYGNDNEPLSFRQRLQICIGSARALHYLHTGTAKPIIHRDVKTANILLDRNLAAKVADFGLSKAGPTADETHVTTAVKGSFGYLDPEYLILQRLTQKSDVYSFGVVLLEVLCGRAVVDPSLPRDEANLVDWAMKRRDQGRVSDIVDPRLAGQVSPESLAKLWETVEKCLADRGALRPSMGDVLWNLETVLRLQGAEERTPSRESNVATETAVDICAVSLGDLAGISMSKVFAQMVEEDVV